MDPALFKDVLQRVHVLSPRDAAAAGGPEPYLFCHTEKFLSPGYEGLFAGRKPATFKSYVETFPPRLREVEVQRGRFPVFRFEPVDSGNSTKDALVITERSWLLRQAFGKSRHAAFAKFADAREEASGPEHPGRGVHRTLTNCACSLADAALALGPLYSAASELLAQCGNQHGLPSFERQHPFPGNFLEAVADFFLLQPRNEPFRTVNLEFSQAPWTDVKDHNAARRTLAAAMSALRDVLLDGSPGQWNDPRRTFNGQTLGKHAEQVAGRYPELAGVIRSAREAFADAEEVVPSKIFLLFLLGWICEEGYYPIVLPGADLTALTSDADALVQQAIMRQDGAGGLAPYVPPPLGGDTDKFADEVSANFKAIILAITAPDNKFEETLARLSSDKMRDFARRKRQDARQVDQLRQIVKSGARVEEALSADNAQVRQLVTRIFPAPGMTLAQLETTEICQGMLSLVRDAKLSRDAAGGLTALVARFADCVDDPQEVEALKNDIPCAYIEEAMLSDERQRIETETIAKLKEGLEMTALADETGASGAEIVVSRDPDAGAISSRDRTPVSAVAEMRTFEALAGRAVKLLAAPTTNGSGHASHPANGTAGATNGSAERPAAEEAKAELTNGAAPPGALHDHVRREAEKEIGQGGPSSEKAKARLPRKIAERLAQLPAARDQVQNGLRVVQQGLGEILEHYRHCRERQEQPEFQAKTWRFLMARLMRHLRARLDLSGPDGALYRLALDVIQHLDPQRPDPKDFIKRINIANYFPPQSLTGAWLTELRQAVRTTQTECLKHVTPILNDLAGKYVLFRSIEDNKEAEIHLSPCDLLGYLTWLENDNLAGAGRQRMVSGGLRRGKATSVIQPLRVYAPSAACPNGDPGEAIAALSRATLVRDGLAVQLPILVFETRPLDREGKWAEQGHAWARAAAADGVPAAVQIVGPSPYAISPDDPFRVVIPAGAIALAYALTGVDPGVRMQGIPDKAHDRFQVMGRGQCDFVESLERLFVGQYGEPGFRAEVDEQLYLYALILGTAAGQGGTQPAQLRAFADCFTFNDAVTVLDAYRSLACLDPIIRRHNARWIALAQNIADERLRTVTVAATARGKHADPGVRLVEVTQEHWWFNTVLRQLGLAPQGG